LQLGNGCLLTEDLEYPTRAEVVQGMGRVVIVVVVIVVIAILAYLLLSRRRRL
jgi:preprotein translocase subunit SecE